MADEQPTLTVQLTKSWPNEARISSANARNRHPPGDFNKAASNLGYTSARKEIKSASLAQRHFAHKRIEMEKDGWKPTPSEPHKDIEENGVKGLSENYEKNGVKANLRTFTPHPKQPQATPVSGIYFSRAQSNYTPAEKEAMAKEKALADEAARVRRARIDKLYEEKFGKPAPRLSS